MSALPAWWETELIVYFLIPQKVFVIEVNFIFLWLIKQYWLKAGAFTILVVWVLLQKGSMYSVPSFSPVSAFAFDMCKGSWHSETEGLW